MKLQYMKSDNYSILYDTDTQVFIVADRNEQRVCSESFSVAALAIEWAESLYVSLV